MNRLTEIKPDLSKLGELLTKAIAAEFIAQGHRATGATVDSIHYLVKQMIDGVELQVLYMDYAKYVESGRRAGAKRVPLAVLENWVRIKGIEVAYKDVKRAAFLIQRKIFQEGSPTSGSYRFSDNGRRKLFQLQVLEENNEVIQKTVEGIMSEWFRIGIEGMASDLKRAA